MKGVSKRVHALDNFNHCRGLGGLILVAFVDLRKEIICCECGGMGAHVALRRPRVALVAVSVSYAKGASIAKRRKPE